MTKKIAAATLSLFVLALSTARADPIIVHASANSVSGGSGVDTGITVNAGDDLWIVAEGCWSAGLPPRTSDADGLLNGAGNPCQEAVSNFNPYQHAGSSLIANFGSLVATIGNSDYFLVGTMFNGIAQASGLLQFYYWDSNNSDNSGQVSVSVRIHDAVSVSEPGTLALLGLSLLGLGIARRRMVR